MEGVDKKGDKTVIGEDYIFVSYVQNFIKHPAVKCNYMCRGNYCASSVWV
jgi:hypothetical protein